MITEKNLLIYGVVMLILIIELMNFRMLPYGMGGGILIGCGLTMFWVVLEQYYEGKKR